MGVLPALHNFEGELEDGALTLEHSVAYARDRLSQEGRDYTAKKLDSAKVHRQGSGERCLREQLYVEGGIPVQFCFLERHWQDKGNTEYRLWFNPRTIAAEELIQRVNPIAPTEQGMPMYAIKTHVSAQEQLDKVVYEIFRGQ